MQHLWRDVVYSVRSLARVPALSATIVLTVGVGLGATTAMLGVVRAVLVSPLPYADPGSLVWIYTDHAPFWFPFSVVDYRALEADHPAFSTVGAYQTRSVTVSGIGQSERITSRAVTGSYFSLLGMTPHVGRLISPSDDDRRDRIAVLTYGYWKQRFGSDPSLVGRTITIDAASYAVVGILNPSVGPLHQNIALFTSASWPPPNPE